MLDGVGWNLFQNEFFIQHVIASNTKNTCWIRLKWFTIPRLISNTISMKRNPCQNAKWVATGSKIYFTESVSQFVWSV